MWRVEQKTVYIHKVKAVNLHVSIQPWKCLKCD